ncbi:uncharacterized protein LOC134533540 [Bacillus rossius redtenbacheri]|uniref:uncharacterized protein LOC134533540 n=1 Tax=Bacillus rossius redtenbacheri TaxID=93214 RepID=UPI002FDE30F7
MAWLLTALREAQYSLEDCYEDYVRDLYEDYVEDSGLLENLPLASCVLLGLLSVAVVGRLVRETRRAEDLEALEAGCKEARLAVVMHRHLAAAVGASSAALEETCKRLSSPRGPQRNVSAGAAARDARPATPSSIPRPVAATTKGRRP